MLELKDFKELYPTPFSISGTLFTDLQSFVVEGAIERVFRKLSDTSAINHKLGIPERYETEVNGKLIVNSTLLGMATRWQEIPWEWSFGKYIIAGRKYSIGPMKNEHLVFHIESIGSNEHRVYFYYVADLEMFLLKPLLKFGFPAMVKKMGVILNQFVSSTKKVERENNNPSFKLYEEFISKGLEEDFSKKLAKYILESRDDEITKIQVPKLAENFQLDKKTVLEQMLLASKVGFFELHWDVICPHCHGGRYTSTSLADLLYSYSCAPCDAELALDSVDLIDVIFKVNKSIREVKEVSFCAAEPAKKEHILVSRVVAPRKKVKTELTLVPDKYRLRRISESKNIVFEVVDDETISLLSWNGFDAVSVQKLGTKLELILENHTNKNATYILERVTKPPYYLSPMDVFSNKLFKSFYSNQKLGAGIQLELPFQYFIFTDIVKSTSFYESVGDKEAYKQVKDHFDLIESVIESVGGVLIKTIGDAVFATIPTPEAGIELVTEINNRLKQRDDIQFKLRYSLHCGRAIAVNYNTGLDYFGESVNETAKLHAIAEADEVGVSPVLYNQFSNEVKKKYPGTVNNYLDGKEGYTIKL